MTVEEVVKTLHTNAGNARAIAAGLLQDVHEVVAEGKELNEIAGSMQFACVTRADVRYPLLPPGTSGADAWNRCSPLRRGRSCRTSCHTLPRLLANRRT